MHVEDKALDYDRSIGLRLGLTVEAKAHKHRKIQKSSFPPPLP